MATIQGTTLHKCIKLMFKTCTPGFAAVLNYSPILCISRAFYFLEDSKTACQPHTAHRVAGFPAGLKRNQPTEGFTLPHCIGHSFGAELALSFPLKIRKHSFYPHKTILRKKILRIFWLLLNLMCPLWPFHFNSSTRVFLWTLHVQHTIFYFEPWI